MVGILIEKNQFAKGISAFLLIASSRDESIHLLKTNRTYMFYSLGPHSKDY